MTTGQHEYVRDFDGTLVLTRRPAFAECFHRWLDMPDWVDHTRICCTDDLVAVVQGGCASGVYMPAVTYHIARDIMAGHGDAVLTYLEEHGYMKPEFAPPSDSSWSGVSAHYLSMAVELWCREALGRIVSDIENAPNDAGDWL